MLGWDSSTLAKRCSYIWQPRSSYMSVLESSFVKTIRSIGCYMILSILVALALTTDFCAFTFSNLPNSSSRSICAPLLFPIFKNSCYCGMGRSVYVTGERL
ncbi:hypothetical protein XELAEV_18021069mg [Xenopus laevis]|uniref:Uncharacterized protein n=1 Tax=Xenopus laevis TaxID=8355 RepID=A0A974D889_XENLA|nr:hypothetical protein XELAEV_18021069mg [Xenopus laevis]